MNYAGFTRPVWTWLRDKGHAPKFLGSPLMVPRLGGRSVLETMREFSAIVPWRTVAAQLHPGRVARHHPHPQPRR